MTTTGFRGATTVDATNVGAREVKQVKRRRAVRKPYCLPCKERRVKCTMERPACVRCQRKTRTHECVYEADLDNQSTFPRSISLPSFGHPSLPPPTVLSSPDEWEATTPGPLKTWEEEFEELRIQNDHSPAPIVTASRPFVKPSNSRFVILHEEQLLDPDDDKTYDVESSNQSLIKANICIPRLEILRKVFINDWLPSSSLLALPNSWNDKIERMYQTGSMPSVEAAVHAIGALMIRERVEAASQYSNCLNQLMSKIHHKANTTNKLEICLTILLLICYEIMNGADIDNYQRHTEAVAGMMKQEAYLTQAGIRSAITDTPLGQLLMRSFRNFETASSCIHLQKPRLTIAEWNILLPLKPDSDTKTIDFHLVFEYMNMSAHLTSRETVINVPLVMRLREELQRTMDKLGHVSMLRPQPKPSYHSVHASMEMVSPYEEGLSVASDSEDQEIHRNTITGMMLATLLHLDLHISGTPRATILNTSEQIMRITQHIIFCSDSCEMRGSGLAWSVHGLLTVKRALLQIGITDERLLWATELLKVSYKTMTS